MSLEQDSFVSLFLKYKIHLFRKSCCIFWILTGTSVLFLFLYLWDYFSSFTLSSILDNSIFQINPIAETVYNFSFSFSIFISIIFFNNYFFQNFLSYYTVPSFFHSSVCSLQHTFTLYSFIVYFIQFDLIPYVSLIL